MNKLLFIWMICGLFAMLITLKYFKKFFNSKWKLRYKIAVVCLSVFLFFGGGVGLIISIIKSQEK